MQTIFSRFPVCRALLALVLAGLSASASAQPASRGDTAALHSAIEALRAQRGTAEPPLMADFRRIEADPALSRAALAAGKRVSSLCINCHGPGGNSTFPDTPNLAGQNPAYLLEQSRRFASGRRRHEFMQGLIRAMSDQEITAVSFYYAKQPVTPRAAPDAALITRGRPYYTQVCSRCHGADGRGEEKIARIAGQPSAYLEKTLRHYRDGSGARIEPLMAENTRLMSDADIRAVSAYVSAMK